MEELMNIDSTVITYTDYRQYKTDLDAELQRSAESFVAIGYLLKVARDTSILKDSCYATVNEFAQQEYGLDKTQVSRFMHINDAFAENGYSRSLKEEYRGYGYAKLSIMLLLPETVNEVLSPDLSKAEIQAVREEIAEEQQVSDIEIMIEGQDEAQQDMNSLHKALHQLGHDDPDLYMKLHGAVKAGGESVKEVLMPAGYKIYNVRPRGTGRLMLSLSEEKGVHLVALRDDSKETYTWDQLMTGISTLMLPDRTAKESWEELYGETLQEKEEVAPVQQAAVPRKESKVVKAKTPDRPQPKAEPKLETEQKPKAEPEGQNVETAESVETTEQQEGETFEYANEENQDTKNVDQSGALDQSGGMENADACENPAGEDAPVETPDAAADAEAIPNGAGHTGVETRRSARVAELEAKAHYWKTSCETHEIALRNRISMGTWDKVAELAQTIRDEAQKILDLQREIAEISDAIQMRIEDMEEQDEETDEE